MKASAAAALGLTRPPTLTHICATCYKIVPRPGAGQACAHGEISGHRGRGYEAISSSLTRPTRPLSSQRFHVSSARRTNRGYTD